MRKWHLRTPESFVDYVSTIGLRVQPHDARFHPPELCYQGTTQRASASRMKRDHEELEKIADKLQVFSPFSNEVSLRNIITVVKANDDANVHNLLAIKNKFTGKKQDFLKQQ